MEFTQEDVQNAYIKLKSYIYYDNTDIILRKQLVEFETNTSKDFLSTNSNYYYNIGGDVFSFLGVRDLDQKFDRIAKELNRFHEDSNFFDALFGDIKIDFYPKKFRKEDEEQNFITNKRTLERYEVERVTPFINAPIELHIISVLWIMRHGIFLDKQLTNDALGNRLLINKDGTEIVQGSGLFKPYFNQYQKWRDDAVEVAVNILKKGKNVAFLNLDIKDYFSSVRIKTTELFDGRNRPAFKGYDNLKEIFLEIHKRYSIRLSKHDQSPYNFYEELLDESQQLNKVVLPIGLVSSYVLANHYLHQFDQRVTTIIKPAYYGRYVDDMLFVVSDPNLDDKETKKPKRVDLERFSNFKLNRLEMHVLETLYPLIEIEFAPHHFSQLEKEKKESYVFKLQGEGYESLFCQSEKSLLHFFDHNESHLVIDKLKEELDERTSEFRDFPEENENNKSFTSSAYHLHYEGSEGKIRTLKDYKENRFGLTVFLSNKIFSALRHENNLTEQESEQIVSFFKGENCLSYYRLWERILTLLLVNKKAKDYVEFFLHCFDQIDRIKIIKSHDKLQAEQIKNTLVHYLDTAHEMALSLNLDFLNQTKKVARNFDFKLNELKLSNWSFLFDRFEPTKPTSFWVRRFRQSNMLRHHYVVHPLLTYTMASGKGTLKDLTSLKIDFKNYKIDPLLVKSSPRRVKFWECCMSVAFGDLNSHNSKNENSIQGRLETTLFSVTRKKDDKTEFYLDEAFTLFKEINTNHIAGYELNQENFVEQFYKRDAATKRNSPIVNVQEIRVSDNKRLDKCRIAFANTKVEEPNIIDSMRGAPNLSADRYSKLARIIRKVRLDKSDILLFPEFFIPINLLSSLVKYSEKNQVLTVTGLEHVRVKNTVFNFIVTILPFEVGGVSDAVVVFRLKNHYAHIEESLIKGNHLLVAKPKEYRYDIFNWNNIYFSPYYCFELANVWHRSLFKSKLDLLIGVEWNRDTNYYSNIVESCSRDLHCYIAQVNTSQFGDTRLTRPVESARLDLLKLKGGTNDAILVAEIDLRGIREFQRQTFDLTHHEKEYKPLPPDYEVENVIKRINNESVL